MDTVGTKPFSLEMAVSRDVVIEKARQLFDAYAGEIYITPLDFKNALIDKQETVPVKDVIDTIYECIQIAMSSISFDVTAQVGIHRSLPLKYTITSQE